MTPQEMSDLHALAFAPERGWQESEFLNFLASHHTHAFFQPDGFVLIRVVAEEAEILTLAVSPNARRQGIADKLMQDWMTSVNAGTAFLEVAADNRAAQALYAKHGFAQSGLRPGYYKRPDGSAVDAVLMQAALTPRQTG